MVGPAAGSTTQTMHSVRRGNAATAAVDATASTAALNHLWLLRHRLHLRGSCMRMMTAGTFVLVAGRHGVAHARGTVRVERAAACPIATSCTQSTHVVRWAASVAIAASSSHGHRRRRHRHQCHRPGRPRHRRCPLPCRLHRLSRLRHRHRSLTRHHRDRPPSRQPRRRHRRHHPYCLRRTRHPHRHRPLHRRPLHRLHRCRHLRCRHRYHLRRPRSRRHPHSSRSPHPSIPA